VCLSNQGTNTVGFVLRSHLGKISLKEPTLAVWRRLVQKRRLLRSATQERQAAALKAWNPADKPDWLDEKTYREKIRPQLASRAAQQKVCATKRVLGLAG
jgi:hypothetical protein